MFPILGVYEKDRECPREVPWRLVEPARAQAMRNHGQTLERLAERGGLGPGELRLALEGKKLWPHYNDRGEEGNRRRRDDDRAWLIALVNREVKT